MERPRRVLIATADQRGRVRIRASAKAVGLRICGYAKNAEDAVETARSTEPDICLIDLDLPGGGLHAAGGIVDEFPAMSVVVLADFERAGCSWITGSSPVRNGLRMRIAS